MLEPGAVIDEQQEDEISVTVIGTGFQHRDAVRQRIEQRAQQPSPQSGSRRRERGGERPFEIRDEDIDVPPFLR